MTAMKSTTELTDVRSRRMVRASLVFVGLALVGYAVSDHAMYGGEPGFGRWQVVIAFLGLLVSFASLAPLVFAQAALLLVASTIAVVAVAEVAGEWLLSARHRPIYQFDERLIFRFIPGRTSTTTLDLANGSETVTHRINADGYRGPELRRDGRSARVVVFGDSFIHAYYTRDEQTFCAQLASALGVRAGRDIEVVNAGVSSYGPDQVALRMERELPQLRPDVVVVSIFAGNDYGDLLRNKIYRLSKDGTLEANAWTIDPKVRTAFDISQRESILKRAGREAIERWRAAVAPTQAGVPASAQLDMLLEEAQREYRSAVVERDPTVTNTHADYYSADVSLQPDSPSALYKVRLMDATLRRIQELAARHQVRLVFMFIPHRFDVADHYDWGPVDKQRFPRYDARNQIAPLVQSAADMKVPALDLYEVFRAAGASNLYLKGGDDHWNGRGQQVAAQAMARLLGELGWPPGAAASSAGSVAR